MYPAYRVCVYVRSSARSGQRAPMFSNPWVFTGMNTLPGWEGGSLTTEKGQGFPRGGKQEELGIMDHRCAGLQLHWATTYQNLRSQGTPVLSVSALPALACNGVHMGCPFISTSLAASRCEPELCPMRGHFSCPNVGSFPLQACTRGGTALVALQVAGRPLAGPCWVLAKYMCAIIGHTVC